MRKLFSVLILFAALVSVGCNKSTTSDPGGDCATTGTNMTFYGGTTAGSPFHNLDVVCFIASPTALKFSGKTLGPGVASGASAYLFIDSSARYKVFLKSDTLQAINVTAYPDTTIGYGQFTPTP